MEDSKFYYKYVVPSSEAGNKCRQMFFYCLDNLGIDGQIKFYTEASGKDHDFYHLYDPSEAGFYIKGDKHINVKLNDESTMLRIVAHEAKHLAQYLNEGPDLNILWHRSRLECEAREYETYALQSFGYRTPVRIPALPYHFKLKKR